MKRKQKNILWHNSPCSFNYKSTSISLGKTKRFQKDSIYDKDDPTAIKRIFNQIHNPQLLLHNFRKQIKEAEHTKHYKAHRNISKIALLKASKQSHKKSLQSTNASRFYYVPCKTQLKYDRNGWRSSLLNDQKFSDENKQKILRNGGNRIDFSKPLNFYPGPGTYLNNTQNRSQFKTLKSYTQRSQCNSIYSSLLKNKPMNKPISQRCKTAL